MSIDARHVGKSFANYVALRDVGRFLLRWEESLLQGGIDGLIGLGGGSSMVKIGAEDAASACGTEKRSSSTQ